MQVEVCCLFHAVMNASANLRSNGRASSPSEGKRERHTQPTNNNSNNKKAKGKKRKQEETRIWVHCARGATSKTQKQHRWIRTIEFQKTRQCSCPRTAPNRASLGKLIWWPHCGQLRRPRRSSKFFVFYKGVSPFLQSLGPANRPAAHICSCAALMSTLLRL